MGQTMATGAELTYERDASGEDMANEIFGDGIQVVSATYFGDNQSSAIYRNGDALAPNATPGDTGVIFSTGRVNQYTRSGGDPNRSDSTSRNTSGEDGNEAFETAFDENWQPGDATNTFDAAYLEATIIPTGDVMTMQFIFASEEYPEFTNSQFQDFVGVWVNDTFVPLSVGNGDADPGNLNSGNNENLFLDNSQDDFNTEMDGLTVTLTLTIPVNAGEENDIRIGIADVADSSYDSALLIAGGSAQSSLIAEDDSTLLDKDGEANLNVLSNDSTTGAGTLEITHINNESVVAGDVVDLNTGQSVRLESDGTITVIGNGVELGDVEDGGINFSYTISDGTNDDTAFVNVIPCFVAGTLIKTPNGDVPIETLEPGDLVETRDEGAQPVRWVGSRAVEGKNQFAPIFIRAGAFGAHQDLLVSPQHRILMRDALAELMFGEGEVLVAAKDLVNDDTVTRFPMAEVIYVHVMFDRHQVIFSEGLETESFLPGPQVASLMEQPVLDEICSLFPELDPTTGQGYGPSARPALRSYEAHLLKPEWVA